MDDPGKDLPRNGEEPTKGTFDVLDHSEFSIRRM